MKHVCPSQQEIKVFMTPGTSIREVAIMRSIKHPNVVSALSYIFKGPDRLYIIMEYCPCTLYSMLTDRLIQHKPLSKLQIKDIMKQILSGVEYLHNQGLIHRDLKSENILLSMEGKVKIADYGLAR